LSDSCKTEIVTPAPGPVFIKKSDSRSCPASAKIVDSYGVHSGAPALWSPLFEWLCCRDGTVQDSSGLDGP